MAMLDSRSSNVAIARANWVLLVAHGAGHSSRRSPHCTNVSISDME